MEAEAGGGRNEAFAKFVLKDDFQQYAKQTQDERDHFSNDTTDRMGELEKELRGAEERLAGELRENEMRIKRESNRYCDAQVKKVKNQSRGGGKGGGTSWKNMPALAAASQTGGKQSATSSLAQLAAMKKPKPAAT
jgi:hypothetical protein